MMTPDPMIVLVLAALIDQHAGALSHSPKLHEPLEIETLRTEVQHVSKESLVRRAVRIETEKGNALTYDEVTEMFGSVDDVPIAALYDERRNKVLMGPDWRPDTVAGRGLLLHELYHRVQVLDGAAQRAGCHGELEEEAMRAQNAYLAMHGHPPHYDEMLLRMVGGCEEY